MAIALTVTGIEDGVDLVSITGTVTFSGNYPLGGDTLDFTTIVGAQVFTRIFLPQSLPVYGSISGTTGDSYGWILGTSLNNGKVKINTTSAAELAAGAYPARITGDVNIYFTFNFPRLL